MRIKLPAQRSVYLSQICDEGSAQRLLSNAEQAWGRLRYNIASCAGRKALSSAEDFGSSPSSPGALSMLRGERFLSYHAESQQSWRCRMEPETRLLLPIHRLVRTRTL